jgi:hypothetical protein
MKPIEVAQLLGSLVDDKRADFTDQEVIEMFNLIESGLGILNNSEGSSSSDDETDEERVNFSTLLSGFFATIAQEVREIRELRESELTQYERNMLRFNRQFPPRRYRNYSMDDHQLVRYVAYSGLVRDRSASTHGTGTLPAYNPALASGSHGHSDLSGTDSGASEGSSATSDSATSTVSD